MMEERRQIQMSAPHPAPTGSPNIDDLNDPFIPDSVSPVVRDKNRNKSHGHASIVKANKCKQHEMLGMCI